MTVPAYLETHTAIVGTTGAGKTVTGKGYVEQLLGDGRQVIVLDPTGAWWGMQSNAAGDGPGLRIPVFGGLHANAPIGADDGVRVAELLIAQRVSAILDLSEMDEEEQRAFSLDFIARMRTKPIGNLHLVIDEADEIAPELVPDSAAFELKRALAWIAKRGRIRGFVLTVITQRPADIAKSVLALAQTMVIHRLIAPQDQAPIDRYLKSHAAAGTRKEVLGSLAGLKRGERWIYSPVEGVLERGTSPALTTFDSSAAPIAGKEASEPQALADVDFAALAEALAASRPRSAEPDPIADAEAQEPGVWDALVARVSALEEMITDSRSAETLPAPRRLDDLGSVQDGLDKCPRTGPDEPRVTGSQQTPAAKRVTAGETAPDLPPRHVRILDAIAWVNAHLARPNVPRWQVAWIAGVSANSSSFANDLGALRSRGLIEYPIAGSVSLTEAGRAIGLKCWQPKTSADRWRAITAKLPPRQTGILRSLSGGLRRSREEIANAAGVSSTSSSFANDLGRLRSLGLIEYPAPGQVELAGVLLR